MKTAVSLIALLLWTGAAGSCSRDVAFSSAKWRDARTAFAESDASDAAMAALQRQGEAAVREGALLGRSREEVEELLGKPDRVGPRRRVLVWDVGLINDTFGPGDEAALYVQFEPGWRRSEAARLG